MVDFYINCLVFSAFLSAVFYILQYLIVRGEVNKKNLALLYFDFIFGGYIRGGV